jgi:hypothetical protein
MSLLHPHGPHSKLHGARMHTLGKALRSRQIDASSAQIATDAGAALLNEAAIAFRTADCEVGAHHSA